MSISASRAIRRRNASIRNTNTNTITRRNIIPIHQKYNIYKNKFIDRRTVNKKPINKKPINTPQLPVDFNENIPYKKEEIINIDSNYNLKYRLLNENTDSSYVINPLWCHVHANDPQKIVHNEDFIKLSKYFSIIFTCDYNISNHIYPEFTFLHIDCKHPNVDRKHYVLKYI